MRSSTARLHLILTACVVASGVAAGCGPNIPEGRFSCTSSAGCPDGWSCREGLCYSEPGGGVDAGGDGDGGPRMDAGPDAGPDTDAGPGVDGGCAADETYCPTRSMCVDLQADPVSCGACDNDCGGGRCEAGECRPAVTDAFHFGASGTDVIRAIADFNGNLIVAGEFRDTVDFGGTSRTSAGDLDGFVASYTTSGTLNWVVRIGASQLDVVRDVATDPARNRVVAVGQFDPAFDGTATVETPAGTETITASGSSGDGFMLALDGDTGAFANLTSTTGIGEEPINAVAIDGSGNVFVAGQNDTAFTVGGLSFANSGFYDGFIVQWDPASGGLSNLFRVASDGLDALDGIAIVDTSVCATGYFSGDLMLGGVAIPQAGGTDGIIVCVANGTGAYQWAQTIATTSDDQIHSLHWNGGDIAFAAVVGAPYLFGPTTIPAPAGIWDIVVGTMSSTGAPGWHRVVSTAGDFDFPLSVRVLSDGRVVATGITTDAVTSPVALPHGGGNDGFLGVWSSTGTLEWARTFGGSGDDTIQDTLEQGAFLYGVGELTGPVDLGTGTLSGFGDRDAFVMQISL